MAFRRVLPALLLLAGILLPSTASADDVESQVFGMINAGRAHPLVLHQGLLQDAESHSQYMSQTGNLNHDNADERVNASAPDPAEADGAPDDGFAQAGWCENATYVIPAQGDPAHAIYNNWRNSAPHAACMNNTGKNVGAVGVYWDGTTWWATFVAEADSTPPGGGGGVHTTDVTDPSKPTQQQPPVQPKNVGVYQQQTQTQAPPPVGAVRYAPAPQSNATAASSPLPSPTPAPVRTVAKQSNLLLPSFANTSEPTKQPGFGMQELAGIIAALVFGCLLLERRLYVPSEFIQPARKKELVTV